MKSAFLIAAPMSGSGKTTVARGLMALFVKEGLRVQPFKCGPDYIDTKFHEAVCGRPSVNLDTFMASEAHVLELFERYTSDADVAVVEGMMGLFDGYDHDRGSCAEIARILNLPVVLVVDARSAAYSMAALLKGFIDFRTDLRFASVIYNKVGSERHAAMLQEVAADVGIPCFGCIPKQTALETGSRYLGLDFSEKTGSDHLVRLLAERIHWQTLLEKTNIRERRHVYTNMQTRIYKNTDTDRRVFVARNAESFSFLYQETLDRLRTWADIMFFDPEDTENVFDKASLIYLPGGYPEKHLEALVRAESTRRAIKAFAEDGGRIVAECGGMMYLCRSILTDDGEYPMCGVLPYSITARKADRRLSLGYRRFVLDGKEYRGHEFHYTQFQGQRPESAAQVYNAKGEPVDTPVLSYKNVLASYTHLYNI
ncbi:MAG: cobyrinate a,c-diamide synthase [Bacteroidaceae bacterium]|nr:cobyrinate a,c-diamide synthase [Bacteroidaceae bacterium]